MSARNKGSRLSLMSLILVCSLSVSAIPPGDENIIISSAKEYYRFEYSRSKKSVEVKQEIDYTYTCLNYRDKGYFSEFFDFQSTLDDVDLTENGKKAYAGKDLEDYSIEDIFYSDARVYRLVLDFPKTGWQNQVKLKKTVMDPRYFCSIYFTDVYSFAEKKVTITIPRWMKAEIKEYNLEKYAVSKQTVYSEKEDADITTYTVKNLKGSKREPNSPGPSYMLPHLLVLSKWAELQGQKFTFFNTLQDQYNWYRKITAMLKNDKAVIKAKAEEITTGMKDDMQKIKAILYWVHEHIRYVAFEDGLAGFKPDEAQHVLNKKYGDCKGMANLTRELLTALGFDARLAWIGTNHIMYDYSTPSLCVDNHMICCLVYKGEKYFLDGTESYLQLGKYAERIQGRQVLVENGDTYLIEEVPTATPEQNLCRFREKLRLTEKKLTGSVEYLYNGESKEQLLHSIHNTKNEQLNTTLERYISNNNKNYTISSITVSDINQIDGDLTIRFDVDHSGAVASFGNELYLDLDYNKIFDQFIFDTTREYDYRFRYKYNYVTETDIELPAGYQITTLPKDLDFSHGNFQFRVTYKLAGNTVQYRKQIKILKTHLPKDSFREWNNAVNALSEKYSEQLILVKK